MLALALQHSGYDCGVAALMAAVRICGLDPLYQGVLEAAGTSPNTGTSAAGLKRGLEYVGLGHTELRTTGRAPWTKLSGHVTICCVDKDQHWVVLMAIVGRQVLVFDPEVGSVVCSRAEFSRRWRHEGRLYGLLLKPLTGGSGP